MSSLQGNDIFGMYFMLEIMNAWFSASFDN